MGKRTIRRPIGFQGQELEGYFMIANKDAATAISSKLTGSQLRLWLYLMMVDSFADRTVDGEKIYHSIPSPADIALKIGSSPETIEKDLRRLRKMGLYDYRITVWQGYNSAAEHARTESKRLKNTAKKSSETKAPSEFGLNKPPESLNKPPESLNKPPESLNKPLNILEPLSDNTSSVPQTYSDFIQTLSDNRREKFLNFVVEETHNWKRPINDVHDFLASQNKGGENRWEVYYRNFAAKEQVRQSHPSSYNFIAEQEAERETRRQRAKRAYVERMRTQEEKQ